MLLISQDCCKQVQDQGEGNRHLGHKTEGDACGQAIESISSALYSPGSGLSNLLAFNCPYHSCMILFTWYLCGVGCNVSSFISDFTYLCLPFISLAKGLSTLFMFSKISSLFY